MLHRGLAPSFKTFITLYSPSPGPPPPSPFKRFPRFLDVFPSHQNQKVMTLIPSHSSIYSITPSRSRSQPRSRVLRVFSVCVGSSSNLPVQIQLRLSLRAPAHAHSRTHTRHIRGETNNLRTGKLFCLVHPCVCFLPRSHQQTGYLMKSALPVPICVRNEFLHFSKSQNLQ